MSKAQFTYTIYVSTTPAGIWNALIDPAMTARYWQHENVSDWKPGSPWEHRRSDGTRTRDLGGRVVEADAPRRLVLTWAFPGDESEAEKVSRVTFDVEPFHDVTRLTVTHDDLQPDSDMLHGISEGWPKVLSSLKSLIEVGQPLPRLW